jgi:hypothetical protein
LWRAKLLTKKKTRKTNYLDFRYRWCKSSTLSWSLRIIIKYCLLVLFSHPQNPSEKIKKKKK